MDERGMKERIIDVGSGFLSWLKLTSKKMINSFIGFLSWLKHKPKKMINSFITILMFSIVVVILLYVGAFILFGIGDLSHEMGNLTEKQDISINTTHFNLSLHKALQYIPDGKVDFLSLAGVTALLLLGLLLLSIFKAENRLVIQPFDVDPKDENLNGAAISEMLIAELKRIRKIHSVGSNSESVWFKGRKFIVGIEPKKVREVPLPQQINEESETISSKVESIGTIGLGSTSLPLGSILIVLKQICPINDQGFIVNGSLQNFGSIVCLAAHINRPNSSWLIRRNINKSEGVTYKDFLSLVEELSYKLYFEMLQFETTRPRPSVTSVLIHPRPSNWAVFKEYIKATENLQNNEIDLAKREVLRALSDDPYWDGAFNLSYNIVTAYLKTGKNWQGEKLARYIVSLRPDSALAWYCWGSALRLLNLDEEAIECFDKALSLKDSIKEHNIEAETYFMKANSLRRRKKYNEAIKYFVHHFRLKNNYGYAWGFFGLTLEAEAKAKELDKNEAKELRKIAKKAYKNAIRLQPDFISVRAALIRIKREDSCSEDEIEKDINELRKYWEASVGQNEYNRACLEMNCGKENKARSLLEIAIDNRQVERKWLEEDPDWDDVREEMWFQKLVENYKNADENITDIISTASVRKKLDEEGDRNPFFFYKNEIEDPVKLSMKIKKNEDGFSKYLSEVVPQSMLKKLGKDCKYYELSTILDELKRSSFPGFIEKIVEDALEVGIAVELRAPKWLLHKPLLYEVFSNKIISALGEKADRLDKLERDLLEVLNKSLKDPNAFIWLSYPEIGSHHTGHDISYAIREKIYKENRNTCARFYAIDGKTEHAINLLSLDLMDKKVSPDDIRFEPDFEFIRNDSRFQALLDNSTKNKTDSY